VNSPAVQQRKPPIPKLQQRGASEAARYSKMLRRVRLRNEFAQFNFDFCII
jgi:hypothetical protein